MRIKHLASIAVLVLLAMFILQNIALVSVSFLIWEITLPRSIILLVVFLIGLLVGMLFSKRSQKRN